MVIQESKENYLETILVLSNEQESVRSIDIVNRMKFSKPSVSIAMRQLSDNGFIEIDNNGFITLLPNGRAIAENIYARHNCIARMLIKLGVDKDTAYADACRIEHDISEQSFSCLLAHYNLHNKN